LEVAAAMLTERGVDAIQISDVAAAAGITRPVVYRFFPNRQALIVEILEDFEDEMNRRLIDRFRSLPGDLTERQRAMMAAVCDTIEAKGAGAWHLLDARGPDPHVAEVGDAIRLRMIEPWRSHIAELTGGTPREVTAVAHMVVAAARVALNLWLDGTLTRHEATEAAARGVSALLREFRAPATTPLTR
jgi:AcrR family transcriptional regulator